MLEIRDILNLLGNELRDNSETSERFRKFIEQEKWQSLQIRKWLDECVDNSSGPQDPYHRAFQDLVVSMGKRLGFQISYGRYMGKSGYANFDGLWVRNNSDIIVLEVKTTTWPIGTISQLGNYVEELSKDDPNKNVFGLYVIGKGDLQPLIEQILGSRYKDRLRLIYYQDLMEIVNLKEELEITIGEKNAIEKIQNLLLPIESINIGNIVKLLLDIALTKSSIQSDLHEAKDFTEEPKLLEEVNEPWTKAELFKYLEEYELTTLQKLLISALVNADQDPVPKKLVLYLMKEIAKRKNLEVQAQFSGLTIAGARSGLTRLRRPLNKEDFIETKWENGDLTFRIKDAYKQFLTEWVKSQNLWIKDEL